MAYVGALCFQWGSQGGPAFFPRFLQGVAGFWGFGVVGFDLCSSAQLLNFSGLGGRFGFACVVVPVNAVPAWLL